MLLLNDVSVKVRLAQRKALQRILPGLMVPGISE